MPERRPVMRPPEIYVNGPEDLLWPPVPEPHADAAPRPDAADAPTPTVSDPDSRARPSEPVDERQDDLPDPKMEKPRDRPASGLIRDPAP